MADPAIGFDRGVDPAAYSPFVGGDRFPADRSRVPQPGEAAEAQRQDLASQIKLGASHLEAGSDAEATECFRKALDMADRTLAPDNPDLILLLNDLTRLYLKQSSYADAEPLLLRLLDIKRVKGEDHPEVATVLASLATVQQALGRHESAEQLWRRVLEIRERTLAPNHFAIATALEHLGDACAARGNIAEALPAFQRALTIRERTLGSAHPSLRVSRERIGDLQLQSAEETLDPSGSSGILAAPEKYRLISGDYLRLSAPTPIPREVIAPIARDTNVLPTVRPARATVQRSVPEPVAPAVPPVQDLIAADAALAMPAELASYRDVLESIRDEHEDGQEGVPLRARVDAILQTLTSLLARRQVVAGIIVVVVSLLLLAVAKDRAWGDFDQKAAASTVALKTTVTGLPATQAAALSIPVRESSNVVASSNAQPKPTPSKPRVEERASARKAEESRSESKKFALPTVSSSILSNLDAVASKTAISSPTTDPLTLQPAPIAAGPRANFEVSEQSNIPLRARLIGSLPTPRVPMQVADVEGDVRVRFSVDAEGVPVMSTFAVVTSPNPLLTAAVRRVIPSMRFAPARTGGSDSRPIADVVETGFRFSRSR